jgi:hypothetical protein
LVLTNSDGADQIVDLSAARKMQLLMPGNSLSSAEVLDLDTLDQTASGASDYNTQSVQVGDVTGDGVADVVVVFKDKTEGASVAGYVYPGVENTPLTNNLLAGSRVPFGTNAVDAVDVALVDAVGNDGVMETIEVVDTNGALHTFTKDDATGTWPSVVYSDPNTPSGSTTPSTAPSDHQDAGGVTTTADFDGDGFPDVISGNQLLLSSLAGATKGDFSAVTPIHYDHGAQPQAVLPFDADGDGDSDLFVVRPTGDPFVLFNDGSGRLGERGGKVVLTGLTPPAGTWADLDVDSMTTMVASGDTAETILLGDSSHNGFRAVKPPVGTGASGQILPSDWETVTSYTIPSGQTGAGQTVQLLSFDLDQQFAGGNTKELLRLNTNGGIDVISSSDGVAWTVSKTMTGPGSATSMDVGDVNGDGVPDIVVAGGGNVMIFHGPDPPKTNVDATPTLSQWGNTPTTGIATLVDVGAGWSIEHIVVADFDNNGYADVMFTAVDGSGNSRREIAYQERATALQYDLPNYDATAPVDVQLTGESTSQVLAITKVDANNDGAMDYVYAYEDGRAKLVLATADTSRTSNIDTLKDTLVDHLALEMNPSTTPDPIVCLDNPSDNSCTTSDDGAWFETQANQNTVADPNNNDGGVTQWGRGQINTENGQSTVTVGTAVDPSTLPDHAPPCAIPGSDVVPVTVEMRIDVRALLLRTHPFYVY